MSNKLVLKNTIYLYFRMVIVMAVQLIVVRVLLNSLGASDYGIYNLVGGIVILFNFLNTSMRGATQRFLNYEMGKGEREKLRATFTNSLSLHLIICLILIIIGETFGLWFLNNKLVITPSRMYEANVLYQFSLLTAIISTIQVPYNAAIISNERMQIYAFVEICRSLTTLFSVYLLNIFPPSERLILYGAIILLINAFVFIFYIIYCNKNFYECRFIFGFDRKIILPMLNFSGWDLYGNVCVAVRVQGMVILLNMFFGTIVNAAGAIATQIQSALLSFGNNVVVAFKPQLIKSYAANNLTEMANLAKNATAVSLILFGIIAVPSIFETPYILEIWLKNPPEYTISLTRISLLIGFFSYITSILNILIHATGKIRTLSFISGTLFLLTIPLAYISLKIFPYPWIAYMASLFISIIVPIANLCIIHRQIPSFGISDYILNAVVKVILILAACSIAPYIFSIFAQNSLLALALSYITYTLLVISLSVLFIFPLQRIRNIISIIKK